MGLFKKKDSNAHLIKSMIKVLAGQIENKFNIDIYKTDVINLNTYENDGDWAIWHGLSIPPLESSDTVYLVIIAFEIDDMDNLVTKDGEYSSNNDWDVQEYISSILEQEVSVVGAYKSKGKRYRTCKFYSIV
tara:strand:+ start:144 stop:539 length:396 start_codon:yes stop_codon:yes gene_type:complete